MSVFKVWGVCLMFCFLLSCGGVWFVLLTGSELVIEYSLFGGVSYSGFVLILDWISLTFLSVVLLISSCVLFYSEGYMGSDSSEVRFCYLVLFFVLSMAFLILSPNLMSLLLGWDGLGLVSYALVIFYQSSSSYNAGMLTVMTNRLGDVGVLMAIIWLVSSGGWNIFLGGGGGSWVAIFVLGASLTKSAQVPFSAWLPAAMAAPTPVSALVHSSTLVTAGVYLLIRFHSLLEVGALKESLLTISLLTLLLAGLSACTEMDFKSVIALSTLSQLGLMMFTLALGCWEVAYFHMLIHALFKALLFLCAGYVIHSVGMQDMRKLGGLCGGSSLVGVGVLVSSFSLCGIPFMSGFYSSDYIIEILLVSDSSFLLSSVFLVSMGLTLVYSGRIIYYLLMKGYMGSSVVSYGESGKMGGPILVMSLVSVIGGSILQWVLFESYEGLFLVSVMSVLIYIVLFTSFWGLVILLGLSGCWSFSGVGGSSYFLSSMWFLPWLASFYILKGLLGGEKFFVSEMGWHEVWGGMGSYSGLKWVTMSLQFSQSVGVSVFFLSLISGMGYCLL